MVVCTLILACTLLVFRHTHALATNRTIDDQNGDSVTGALPSYFPEVGWSQGNQCKTCSAQPDPQKVFAGTWHDNTISATVGSVEELRVTMSFNGTAVYAYCILDNNNTYTTFTNLTFSLDGAQVGSFSHRPDGSGSYLYNALVYVNTSVPNGNHTFVIRSPRSSIDSFMLFDYVQYTNDQDAPTSPNAASSASSHSSTAARAIAGGVVGGVLGLGLIVGILFLGWRRRRRSDKIHFAPTDVPLSYHPLQALNDPNLLHARASPQQRGRFPTEKARKEKISRQLEERQQQLAALRRTSHSGRPQPPLPLVPTAVDTVNGEHGTAVQSQVENLQREVARLREMMEVTSNDLEAPPQYHG